MKCTCGNSSYIDNIRNNIQAVYQVHQRYSMKSFDRWYEQRK
jgi:hypothetical protein